MTRARYLLKKRVAKSSHRAVGKELGTSQQNVWRWCNEGLRPDSKSIERMIAIGIKPGDWFEMADPKKVAELEAEIAAHRTGT